MTGEIPLDSSQCTNAGEFEIGVRIQDGRKDGFYVTVVNLRTGVTEVDRLVIRENIEASNVTTGCNWIVHVGEPPRTTGPAVSEVSGSAPLRITFEAISTPGLVYQYTYSLCSSPTPTYAGSFYCPAAQGGGFPDLLMYHEVDPASPTGYRMRVAPTTLFAAVPESSDRDVARFFDDDNWILPYNRDVICAAGACKPGATDGDVPFLTPQAGPVFTATAGVTLRVPDGRPGRWGTYLVNGAPDVTEIRFPAGTGLSVGGSLDATGVSFTAAEPAWGWNGIRYEPGSTGTLSGVTVSGARFVRSVGLETHYLYPPAAGVTASDATVTITGGSQILRDAPGAPPGGTSPGTVSGANGVLAYGPNARLTVTGGTIIRGNGGFGAVAAGSTPSGHIQTLLVDGQFTLITDNSYGGVLAAGSTVRALVTGYASVDGNGGPGAQADFGGQVLVRSPQGLNLNTSVSGNYGGLTSRTGGIDGNLCVSGGGRPNAFVDNTQNQTLYDARALEGATILAREAYWGPGRSNVSDLILDKDKSSGIDANEPRQNADDVPVTCLGYRASGAEPRWMDAALAGRGLDVSAAVIALVSEARAAAWDDDLDTAFERLAGARAAVQTEDDREAVFGASAALLAEAQPAGLLADLEAAADGDGPDRLWARREVAAAYAASGRTAEADALALSLTTEAAHASFGHGLRVRLAVAGGDEADALTRLVDFAGSVSEVDTSSVEALAASLALVAAAFPEADLSGVAGAPLRAAGRSGDSATLAAAGRSDAAALAARGGAAGVTDGVEVYPNPTAGRSAVQVSVSTPATAIVAVYDALGRRVATLHDGPMAAGAHALAFDASALPPGVYVVHVRATPEGGVTWTEVRRVTVAR